MHRTELAQSEAQYKATIIGTEVACLRMPGTAEGKGGLKSVGFHTSCFPSVKQSCTALFPTMCGNEKTLRERES